MRGWKEGERSCKRELALMDLEQRKHPMFPALTAVPAVTREPRESLRICDILYPLIELYAFSMSCEAESEIDLWALDENTGANAIERQATPEKVLSMIERDTARRKGVSEMWNSFVKQVESAVTSASMTILSLAALSPLLLLLMFTHNAEIDVGTKEFLLTEVLEETMFKYKVIAAGCSPDCNTRRQNLQASSRQTWMNEKVQMEDYAVLALEIPALQKIPLSKAKKSLLMSPGCVPWRTLKEDRQERNVESARMGRERRSRPATCELEKDDLPHGLIRFFSTDVCCRVDSRPTECTVPRFFLHIGGKLDLELVINSAAEQLSYDLVQHYLKLINERIHHKGFGDVHKNLHVDINSEANRQNSHHALVTPQAQVQDAVASKGEGSCINDSNIEGTNVRPFPLRIKGDHVAPSQPYGVQDSFPRSGKVRKGNLSLAIATFGYQILRLPQFAELVWLTSKLKEGPCTDISGEWKYWPFNTCVMHTEDPHEKRISGPNSCNVNDMVSAGVVRGLIAVGLLAYRGFYTSVSEVSTDVRKVLELLVGQIRAKLFGRKDRYSYLRVTSQVAYLDDMHIASKDLINKGLESSLRSQRLRSLDQIPSLTEHNRCNHVNQSEHIEKGTSKRGTSLDTVFCSNHKRSIPNEQLDDSTSYIFQENDSLSKASCLYNCCSNCVHMVNVMAHKMISSYLKLDGCYSIDDVHDIITSCSLNILASFKKFCISESNVKTHLEEDPDDVFKRKPCHCKALMKMKFLPAECNCHTGVEDDTTSTGSDSGSLLETKFTHFFRDGVLVPSIPNMDSDLHCNFQKICLCSVTKNRVQNSNLEGNTPPNRARDQGIDDIRIQFVDRIAVLDER
ncbi:hypothetical protein KSP40_PGU002745 [Platanthera guangdongensis]|uniref:Uncharacterized protein n=1 Tax=Platanthera guangdongensis TaxID=2320717 RepID=A0ABR2LKL2_9ASPA